MNVEEATKIVQMPYNTEKTFAMVESEGKVCFLVERSATKPSIIDAVEILYGLLFQHLEGALVFHLW